MGGASIPNQNLSLVVYLHDFQVILNNVIQHKILLVYKNLIASTIIEGIWGENVITIVKCVTDKCFRVNKL